MIVGAVVNWIDCCVVLSVPLWNVNIPAPPKVSEEKESVPAALPGLEKLTTLFPEEVVNAPNASLEVLVPLAV